jgi:hypothetical protein
MATPPSSDVYIAVRCDGVSRYAPLAEFLGAMTTLDAVFTSVKTPTGSLIVGPSFTQFNKVSSLLSANHNSTVNVLQTMDALEARVTAMEARRALFDDEFSQEFN